MAKDYVLEKRKFVIGGVAVCIHEPSCSGVIIAGLEVIEAAFGIVE